MRIICITSTLANSTSQWRIFEEKKWTDIERVEEQPSPTTILFLQRKVESPREKCTQQRRSKEKTWHSFSIVNSFFYSSRIFCLSACLDFVLKLSQTYNAQVIEADMVAMCKMLFSFDFHFTTLNLKRNFILFIFFAMRQQISLTEWHK